MIGGFLSVVNFTKQYQKSVLAISAAASSLRLLDYITLRSQ